MLPRAPNKAVSTLSSLVVPHCTHLSRNRGGGVRTFLRVFMEPLGFASVQKAEIVEICLLHLGIATDWIRESNSWSWTCSFIDPTTSAESQPVEMTETWYFPSLRYQHSYSHTFIAHKLEGTSQVSGRGQPIWDIIPIEIAVIEAADDFKYEVRFAIRGHHDDSLPFYRVQVLPKECFPGLEDIAYHFCLRLPATFSKPGKDLWRPLPSCFIFKTTYSTRDVCNGGICGRKDEKDVANASFALIYILTFFVIYTPTY